MKTISPYVENPEPFSPEMLAARKKRMEDALRRGVLQEPKKKNFLDTFLGWIRGEESPVVGMGPPPTEEDIKGLSQVPNEEMRPPVSPDVPLNQEVLDYREEFGDEWEQAGRPRNNPYYRELKEVFGDNADDMNSVLRWGVPDDQGYGVNYGGENLSYDAEQVNVNDDGSRDIGLFQINENTFADFMRRKPDKIRGAGISNFEDLFDPLLNIKMAKIIFDEQGFNAWYGAPQSLRENQV